MGFSDNVRDQILAASGRRCCVCGKFCGRRIELHHIVPKSQGGNDTYENVIALCFDCHCETGHYNPKHPRGSKYSPEELRKHKDRHVELMASGTFSDSLNGSDGKRTLSSSPNSIPDVIPLQAQNLIKFAESANPGIKVKCEITSDGVATIVCPRSPNDRIRFAIDFPDTDAGKEGRRKSLSFFEEGRSICLLSGEWKWKEGQEPPLAPDPDGTLTLASRPGKPVLVCLTAEHCGKRLARINRSCFVVARAGSKEIEICIQGEDFCGSLETVLRAGGAPSTAHLKVDLGNAPLPAASATVDLILAACKGADIVVRPVQDDKQLVILRNGISLDVGQFEFYRTVLDWMIAVENRFHLGLTFPGDDISGEDIRLLEIVALGIQHGRVAEKGRDDVSVKANPVFVKQLLEYWDRGDKPTMTFDVDSGIVLFGKRLPLGTYKLALVETTPRIGLDELHQISQSNLDDDFDVPLECSRIVHVFSAEADFGK